MTVVASNYLQTHGKSKQKIKDTARIVKKARAKRNVITRKENAKAPLSSELYWNRENVPRKVPFPEKFKSH